VITSVGGVQRVEPAGRAAAPVDSLLLPKTSSMLVGADLWCGRCCARWRLV